MYYHVPLKLKLYTLSVQSTLLTRLPIPRQWNRSSMKSPLLLCTLLLSGCGLTGSSATSSTTTSTSTTVVGEVSNPSSVANYSKLTNWNNYSYTLTTGVATTSPSIVQGQVYSPADYRIVVGSTHVTTTVVDGQGYDTVAKTTTKITLPKYYLSQLGVGGSASLFINGLRSVGEYLKKAGNCHVASRLGEQYLEGNYLAKVNLTTKACIDVQTGGLLSLVQGLGGVSSPQTQTYKFVITGVGDVNPITAPALG